jgi:hypothetical protein
MDKLNQFFVPGTIVSGGQTGVDRGAFEAAIALGIPHGGWCPAGRMSEDGTIPSRYQVTELPGADYAARTEQNVIDSDATLILYESILEGGTRLTRRVASRIGKPCLTQPLGELFDADRIRRWLDEFTPQTLNIAGPRESKFPGIQERSLLALLAVFS